MQWLYLAVYKLFKQFRRGDGSRNGGTKSSIIRSSDSSLFPSEQNVVLGNPQRLRSTVIIVIIYKHLLNAGYSLCTLDISSGSPTTSTNITYEMHYRRACEPRSSACRHSGNHSNKSDTLHSSNTPLRLFLNFLRHWCSFTLSRFLLPTLLRSADHPCCWAVLQSDSNCGRISVFDNTVSILNLQGKSRSSQVLIESRSRFRRI